MLLQKIYVRRRDVMINFIRIRYSERTTELNLNVTQNFKLQLINGEIALMQCEAISFFSFLLLLLNEQMY